MMTLEEIKEAVNEGKTVHWASDAYTVVKRSDGEWYILCTVNNNAIGLTWRDGVTMNGKPEQFYIADEAARGGHRLLTRRATALADLSATDDAVGDVVHADEQLSTAREKPFIWLDGEVLLGEGLDGHTGIIDAAGNITDAARKFLRFAAGHVIGDVAIVEEATCTNVDPAEVVTDVLAQLSVAKVYLADTAVHPTLERAAANDEWT